VRPSRLHALLLRREEGAPCDRSGHRDSGHRAIISAAVLHPPLALEFYDEGPGRAQGFLASHLAADAPVSPDLLFTALLGEPHRRRLLGLAGPLTSGEIDAHVDVVLRAFGLSS